MSISIVTVVLNAAGDLPLTIESVRQQDYGDVELILIDGGSYDTTAAVVSLYADTIKKVVRVEDAGIYHAMNIALDHCSHEYVLFLNAKDTLFCKNTLSRMMACKEQDADVFFGNHIYVANGREYFKRSFDYSLLARLLLYGEINHHWLARLPGHQATFVRLDLLRRLRFNINIAICADHDLLMRAYRAGARFQYIDQTVSHYVGGGFSAQRPDRLMLEWCSLYREFSADPVAVDRFFLGDVLSPFSPQSSLTGICVFGSYPRETILNEDTSKLINWCRPDGTQLRSPVNSSSKALRINGFCPLDGQILRFFRDGEEIGSLALNRGWFRRSVDFAVPVSSMAIVEIFAARFTEVSVQDERVVGFAIGSFSFDLINNDMALLAKGSRVAFSQKNRVMTERMLGDGWADQENDHIWTIGEVAQLRLRVAPTVKTLVLCCKGNPYIEDHEIRGTGIVINGKDAGRYLLGPKDPQDVVLSCPDTTDGVLQIIFRPLARICPPQDRRMLGFSLIALECC